MSQVKNSTQRNRLSQTWDKYMQLELEEEVVLEQNEVLIVNHPNNFKQTLTFVQTMLTDQPDKQITLKSKGQSMMKAIKIAEILKRKIPELHQLNRIISQVEKKHFIPLEEGLDEIILENQTVYFIIKLFINQNELVENEPGYQPPLELEEVQENEKSSRKNQTSRNTSFNQNSINSKNFNKSRNKKTSQPKGIQDIGINNTQNFPPFNNQIPLNPLQQQQMMINPKLFNPQQIIMANQQQIQNPAVNPKKMKGMKNMNLQNQQQFGQFIPGMMNPQQLGINRTSEFNLDQSGKTDEDESYESDSEQDDQSQNQVFDQFGQRGLNQNKMFQQNMKIPINQHNIRGGPQSYGNQMMMQNPNMMNQMMMQNQKNFRQINLQNAMGQQYQQFNNRNNPKSSQKSFQQYPNQRYQNNNRNNNKNNNRNNNKNNKNFNKNKKNNRNNKNNRRGMQHQNSRNSFNNSQSYQSNNSFAQQNNSSQQYSQKNQMHHKKSFNTQSQKNLRQANQNPMTQSQQKLNNYNMFKQNQPMNIGQQNMSQQQIMQILAQQQQLQGNKQSKLPFNQFNQQRQGNPMFPQMQPNPFLQKNIVQDDDDDDEDESSDQQTSSEEETQEKKKPNMLKQRIMMKNEKNQLLKKQSMDQSKNQNLHMNQIGQNLFAQPPINQQGQNIQKQIKDMMLRNQPQQGIGQPIQQFPPSNPLSQNTQIQTLENLPYSDLKPMKVQQELDDDSNDTDSDDKTENDDDSEEEIINPTNPKIQQNKFQPPNQNNMNYFMRMNQQNPPIIQNPNFASQFPPYMQSQNFEEMQKKIMQQKNQPQMFLNMKANQNNLEDDSEESDESDDQSDNQFQIYYYNMEKYLEQILQHLNEISKSRIPRISLNEIQFLAQFIKKKSFQSYQCQYLFQKIFSNSLQKFKFFQRRSCEIILSIFYAIDVLSQKSI